METEFKLRFASYEEMKSLWDEEWFRDILIPNSEKTEEYTTCYYDTENATLRSQRATVRIRSVHQGGYIHTVKIGKPGRDGLHQRFEWNLETDREDFDSHSFAQNSISDGDPTDTLEELLSSIEGMALKEICRTEFSRTMSLAGYGDSLMEVSIDSGYLYADEKKEQFFEMEIELKKGDVRDVIAFGEEIESKTQASRCSRSKFSRCMELAENP